MADIMPGASLELISELRNEGIDHTVIGKFKTSSKTALNTLRASSGHLPNNVQRNLLRLRVTTPKSAIGNLPSSGAASLGKHGLQ